MAGSFKLADCLRKAGTIEENMKLTNSLHKCWSCANAYGGCEWTEVDRKTGHVRFGEVPGWKVRRSKVYGGGTVVERVQVLRCPRYREERK